MIKVEIIKNDDEFDFANELENFMANNNVIDIKFAVTPIINGSLGSSYSNGEIYYAMIRYNSY